MPNMFRHGLFAHLWQDYVKSVPYFQNIFGTHKVILDHFAIIDIPSKNSGIAHLKKLMSLFGLSQRGAGYLPEKCNDFIWVAEEEIEGREAEKALLQPVLADFRLDEMSPSTRKVIYKYIRNTDEVDMEALESLAGSAFAGNKSDKDKLLKALVNELNRRPWDLPTTKDYMAVKEENQLLAWVLLNGRKVNHFGICIHFDLRYKNLNQFNNYIADSSFARLNNFSGVIKGNAECGIEQSATLGQEIITPTADGTVETSGCFMEFVWRHPLKAQPKLWGDYFTGFIPKNANNIIESIYS